MNDHGKANTVWMPRQQKGVNVSPASDYGCIVNVFPPSVSPFDVAAQVRFIQSDVLPVASRWDYVLNVGPAVMLSTFVAAWVYHFRFCRMLCWDRRPDRRCYTVTTIRPDPENDAIADREARRRAAQSFDSVDGL